MVVAKRKGYDTNGNSVYKIEGYITKNPLNREMFPAPKWMMKSLFGGRYSRSSRSITVPCEAADIERILYNAVYANRGEKPFDQYRYVIIE